MREKENSPIRQKGIEIDEVMQETVSCVLAGFTRRKPNRSKYDPLIRRGKADCRLVIADVK